MNDLLSTSIRQLIIAQTDEELSHAAATALDRLLDADQSAVILADECAQGNQIWAALDSLDVSDQGPLISGIVGQAFTTGESWTVDDLTDTRSAGAESALRDPTRYRSLLCVPVDEWGTLVAVSRDVAAFSDDDIEAVELLQSYVAAASTRITTPGAPRDTDDRIQEVGSILTHDISSPLMVANGHLELAREECDSDHLAKVATAHARLEELIEDVVTLARTGERVGATEGVDLREIAEQAWAMVQAPEAKLTIGESATIVADTSRLCQLLENLLRNAVIHGGPTVTVQVGTLAHPTGFYVEDDGPGIPANERETIFDRGHSSDEHGSGLGLFIVKSITDAHGWEIIAKESSRGGARFEITDVDTT